MSDVTKTENVGQWQCVQRNFDVHCMVCAQSVNKGTWLVRVDLARDASGVRASFPLCRTCVDAMVHGLACKRGADIKRKVLSQRGAQ